jgi:hypothetical protein
VANRGRVAATILTASSGILAKLVAHLDLAAAIYLLGHARIREEPGMAVKRSGFRSPADQGSRTWRCSPCSPDVLRCAYRPDMKMGTAPESEFRPASASASSLAAWYGFHYWRTGLCSLVIRVLRYNVELQFIPLRILHRSLIRFWQTFGYFRLLMLTLAALFAMGPPLRSGRRASAIELTQFATLRQGLPYSPWRWWVAPNWSVTCRRCRW